MRRSGRLIRLFALMTAALFCISVFPMEAFTEQVFSEWFSLEPDHNTAAEAPRVLEASGKDYTVRVTAGKEAALPEDASLSAVEIGDTAACLGQAAERLAVSEKRICFLRLFDLSILSGGEPVQPQAPVRVDLEMAVEGERIRVLHFLPEEAPAAGEPASELKRTVREAPAPPVRIDVLEPAADGGTLSFEAESFSLYAVVGYTLEKGILASDGRLYRVTVTYGEDAGIPEGAQLAVQEILQGEGALDEATVYERYAAGAKKALGWQDRVLTFARFFDIAITDRDGVPVQPAEGAAVRVDVTLADLDAGSAPGVVHFAGAPDGTAETVAAGTEGNTVTFSASSFSVYGIVDAPEPAPSSGWNRVSSLEELALYGGTGLLVHHPDGYYFRDEQYTVKGTRTGIRKTKPPFSSPAAAAEGTAASGKAALYYFEPVEGESNRYTVYCETANGRRYVRQNSDSLSLVGENQATVFTVEAFPGQANTFRVLGNNGYYWNMQGNAGGNGFAAWNSATDMNARIQLEYYFDQGDDPYGLDGQTYGIAFHDQSVTAAAMTAEAKTSGNQQRLAGTDLVMRTDVLDFEGLLLVAENSDITEWTFECVSGDTYYLTTTVGEQKKYLTINGNNVTLEDEPDPDKSVITAKPGTGAYAGKWHFSVGTYSLNLPGASSAGFNAATGTGEKTWMNLVRRSVLTEDDFHTYYAKKVSVSDTENVYNGQQVVIYTRVWNDTAKRYDFYAVNHDGALIPCYDNGDGIEWVGSEVNTALWDFTEYRNPDGTVNYFYELRNTQYGEYIAPQEAEGRVLGDGPIGINLNGRRYGRSYSTILAWDDDSYSYSGMKVQDGHVVACPLAEAEDFYFAVVNPIDPQDTLSTVDTLDNNHYGITMKMVDYNNSKTGTADSPRDSVQNPFFGGDNNNAGLLSTDLDGNYPTTTSITGNAGRSLGELYSGAQTVNHLFISSIHNESGYFEYDSTSNFARLNGSTFTVYDQLGAIGNYGTVTGTHGQFMPYNDLIPGKYCTFTNATSVTAAELPDTNPRKGEKLYNIGTRREVDYHFGMEMTAQFTQTASGLDAWGHDIIFEFSGDDDFWFYVDGELVLDLGGVHSAMTGSINFRTGEVKSSRGNSTLYEVFRKNYQARGLSEAEISTKLNEIFVQNENGQYIFKDYTNHTMRMFYMERGAGASNLHMRFNLAAVRPGSFILTKKLSGTDSPSNDLIEFPYQIWYTTREDGGTVPHLLGAEPGEKENVFYRETTRNVKYSESFTPAGGTAPYDHVFFLKPGEAAEVNMPENTLNYWVTECGVRSPSVYDHVKANGNELAGQASGNADRKDYPTGADTLDHRPQVDFDNHVREGAMRELAITKKLYAEDGETLLHYPDNSTLFTFRLYLGSENEAADNLPLANQYRYYVKDPDGNYCRRVGTEFVSLGITDFADLKTHLATLTPAQQEKIAFVTSQNGTISQIPADYTVEVRDLIIGTQYKVEERLGEIPKGYTLRVADGYTRMDVTPQVSQGQPYSGTVQDGESPVIQVRNQKGWGLTVEKVWSDRDFMVSHDPVYYAVYLTDGQGGYTLLDGSVRCLAAPETSIYYFFDNLQAGTPFENYVIFEVNLSGDGLIVDSEGRMTGWTGITRVAEGGTLTVGGTPVGGSHRDYDYTVHYEVGEITDRNENIRVDRVYNSRPGIALYKTKPDGSPLAGAVFTLKNENGEDVSAASFTSADDGLITIAYLPDGTYYLTETAVPVGYTVMDSPITIIAEGSEITVSGGNESLYTVTEEGNPTMIRITIRNRPADFRARKVDGDTGEPVPGTHFALYRQVTDIEGNPKKDYLPIHGYEDLVTDEDGLLAALSPALPRGTYYLTETRAAENYVPLGGDLCFTLGEDGTVTVNTEEYRSWLQVTEDPESGTLTWVLSIENRKPGPVTTEIECFKMLRGRDLGEGEFSFLMTPVDAEGLPVGESIRARNTAAAAGEESRFTFSRTYTLEDYANARYRDEDGNAVFLYLVNEEISPDADENGFDSRTGIVYDRTVYLLQVTVLRDAETGLLNVEKSIRVYDPGMLPLNESLGLLVRE